MGLIVDMSVNRNVDLGFLQMQVLWLLSKKPAHGYWLMERLSAIKHSPITQGTLYPTLAKLESMGFIKAAASGVRGRKTYSLTAKGRRAADESCREFISIYQSIFYDYCCVSCGGKGSSLVRPVQLMGVKPAGLRK